MIPYSYPSPLYKVRHDFFSRISFMMERVLMFFVNAFDFPAGITEFFGIVDDNIDMMYECKRGNMSVRKYPVRFVFQSKGAFLV